MPILRAYLVTNNENLLHQIEMLDTEPVVIYRCIDNGKCGRYHDIECPLFNDSSDATEWDARDKVI